MKLALQSNKPPSGLTLADLKQTEICVIIEPRSKAFGHVAIKVHPDGDIALLDRSTVGKSRIWLTTDSIRLLEPGETLVVQ